LVAAALIVILAVLIMIPSEEFRNSETGRRLFPKKPKREVLDQDAVNADQQERESAGQLTDMDAESQEAESQETDSPQTESQEADRESGQTISPEPHKFFIIAGSFKKLKNASDLQDQLNARGYRAEVMITENRMYRVSVASYATKAEAEQGLKQLSSEAGLQSCWLLSN